MFRLKKEAVPYFKEKHATSIYSYATWEKLGVDDRALEEVKSVYLSYGHDMNSGSKTLCGWDENGSRFQFTIHFPSLKYKEHDMFSKDRMIRELMNKIQSDINDFQSKFLIKGE